jgi:hypothetical protein
VLLREVEEEDTISGALTSMSFARKRETIQDDDRSSSCGEHSAKEERCFLSTQPARKERPFIPALEKAGLSGPFSVSSRS